MKIPHHTPQSGRSQNSLSVLPKQPLLNNGVRAVWMAGVGGWALIAVPSLVSAAPVQKAAKGTVQVQVSAKMQDRSSRGATYNLPMGRTLQFQPPKGFQFRVEEGAESVQLTANDGILAVKPQRLGRATIVVDAPNAPTQTYLVRVVDSAPADAAAPAAASAAETPAAPEAVTVTPATVAPAEVAPATGSSVTGAQVAFDTTSVPATPAAADSSTVTATNSSVPASNLTTAPVTAPTLPAATETAQISPAVRIPARLPVGKEPFPTRSQLPRIVASQQAAASRNTIAVSQGLARLLRFNTNILAVFFSDVNVMDARAVNARTVALTGLGAGTSTLAVFSERFPGDAVGKANIYQISVRPQGSSGIKAPAGDPESLAAAIRTALGDSRVSVSVLQTPDGSLAARLTGVLRDQSEIDAAKTTTALFVPQVISSLYVDKAVPIPGESSSESQLQQRLRQISGNDTIELIALPNGLTMKAVVATPAEAQQLLALVPLATTQKVMPFIIVRGAAGSAGEAYDGPTLSGEDQEMTNRLHSVTGVNSVYAVRTADNGLAVYGTVRNRREYDLVRRYSIVLPQVTKGAGAGGTNSDINLPSAANKLPTGIQWFVRVLDESDSTVRMVTADTSIVEISRSSLKNLGIEYGSAQVTSENIDNGGTTTVIQGGVPTVVQNQPSITRTIDPTFRAGEILAGNGFAGFGNRGLIDPVRLHINALAQRGDIRVLSNPTIQAVEGASAQITIGGSRPIPQALTVGGGGGSAALQNVIFRKYGIILTMRPTLTDDDTIILQIRADVTSLDSATAVVINGALIPGETIRSVDTTLTLKEGDLIVMGGLMTNDRSMRTSKVPILSDIPIIGSLFTSKRFENNQSELAIFMTPHIRRVQASPNTMADVTRVPALPELPGIQNQNNIFANSTGGQ